MPGGAHHQAAWHQIWECSSSGALRVHWVALGEKDRREEQERKQSLSALAHLLRSLTRPPSKDRDKIYTYYLIYNYDTTTTTITYICKSLSVYVQPYIYRDGDGEREILSWWRALLRTRNWFVMFASEVPPIDWRITRYVYWRRCRHQTTTIKPTTTTTNNYKQQTANSNKNCNNHKCSLCVKRKRFCLQNVFKLCSCYSSFYIFVNYDYNIMYTARWHAHSFSALGSASQQLHQQQQMKPRKMFFVFGLLTPPRCCGKVLIAAAVGAAAATRRSMRPTLLCVFSMYYRKPLLTDPFASAISSKGRMWNKKSTKKQQK